MLKKVVRKKDLDKLKFLFRDIKFYMGRSTLEGLMGKAYADTIRNPQFAVLIIRKYCFMSGWIDEKKLYKLINNNLKQYIIIPSNNLKYIIEKMFEGKLIKGERYSIKKDTIFNKKDLQKYVTMLPKTYQIKKIDSNLEKKIKKEEFLKITDDYKAYGIGVCCMYNEEIIGVASSNIFYSDGIEVNVKVKSKYRKKGIATALASELILQCLKENKRISWDAANIESKNLAEKLGFLYDSTYEIYKFK